MAAKPLVSRGKGLSDRPQTCGLRARFPDCLSTHRFAGFDGQQSGRECIFLFRTDPQFSMVVPLRSQARLWLSLLHWAYYGLFPPLAAAFVRPCASLARCSVPAHFVCSALQPFGPSPFCKHLLPKNTRNDVHAVISDLSLVLPMLCQCSGILPGRAKTYIECTLPSIGDTHCGKWECSAHPPSKDPWP